MALLQDVLVSPSDETLECSLVNRAATGLFRIAGSDAFTGPLLRLRSRPRGRA